jgi:hypothetical protein
MRSATRGYSDFEGKRILTLDGGYAGKDGVCLGKIGDHPWAVLPDGSDEILQLRYEEEFGILIDLSSEARKDEVRCGSELTFVTNCH